MPWDAGRVPASLDEFIARHRERGRILVPGCGTGYEVRRLAEAGFDVLAIDFSQAAIEAAQAHLGEYAARVRLADYFDFAGDDTPFDALYERAFLCALPRRMWGQWAARTAQLVRPGGLLFGLFFFDNNSKGPPFGTSQVELDALLGASFSLTENLPVNDSVAAFAGRERWQVWQRKVA